MSNSFHTVVSLYRQLEKSSRQFTDGIASGIITFCDLQKPLFKQLLCDNNFRFEMYKIFSSISEHFQEGEQVFDSKSDDIEDIDTIFSCDYILKIFIPQNELGAFYQNADDWLERKSGALDQACFEQLFYLVKEDEISSAPGTIIRTTKSFCDFTNALKKIADYHDEKSKKDLSTKLVFVVPTKESNVSSTITIDTSLSSSLFDLDVPDSDFLFKIASDVEHKTINSAEKLAVLKISIVDIVKELDNTRDSTIFFIVKNWKYLLEVYNSSWENYLNGFSFHKLKAELEEQKTIFAQKLSDAVIGLSGKLLSIPLSIGALSFLDKPDNVTTIKIIIYYISALILTYTVRSSILIQYDCLNTIRSAYESIFEKKNSKINKTNQSLALLIQNNLNQLDVVFIKLQNKIQWYLAISWLPILTLEVFYFAFSYDALSIYYSSLYEKYNFRFELFIEHVDLFFYKNPF
ncbi:TPA: hypothetical protein RVS02_002749 [Aeromonas veronii]|uniref:hypothetical protein n=1 Tax=Aeromonas veronii TaxID=654 RepID=UPI00191E6C99|nr:hypothetical protein [Aeromonas veronii]MBL0478716.1 hypothetical protein [Aeromonas veronii]HEA3201215.1 hypothetical protein [Aeromonas veronii]